MQIRAGFTLTYDCPKPTPMLLTLNIHPSRVPDLSTPQLLTYSPRVETWDYTDGFGNICTRLTAPAGPFVISTEFEIRDSGLPDEVVTDAVQHDIRDLPDDVLVYLLGSRYCETDLLSNIAWTLFEYTPPGWPRVQAILDWVHNHIRFDYMRADATRTAHGAYIGQVGVCRDYTHLAIAFCRCMNIPARYCTGYLGDIGNVPVPGPMDFSAWLCCPRPPGPTDNPRRAAVTSTTGACGGGVFHQDPMPLRCTPKTPVAGRGLPLRRRRQRCRRGGKPRPATGVFGVHRRGMGS